MVELGEKFNAKKAKIIEDGENFNKNLNEFIEKSKKEVAQLRAAQEVRRQKESVIRQQVAKQNKISNNSTTAEAPGAAKSALPIANGDTTTNNYNSANHQNGIVSMDVDQKQAFQSDEVQIVLDSLVAKIV